MAASRTRRGRPGWAHGRGRRHAWAGGRTRRWRGGAAWVDGEPGIGKSALLAALLADARRHGCRVFSAPAEEFVRRFPLRVDRLCSVGPVSLVVDDLQWADEDSLAVLSRLHRMVPQLPLLLVTACRPVPARAEVDRLRRGLDDRAVRMRLGGLSERAVAELVARAFPGGHRA